MPTLSTSYHTCKQFNSFLVGFVLCKYGGKIKSSGKKENGDTRLLGASPSLSDFNKTCDIPYGADGKGYVWPYINQFFHGSLWLTIGIGRQLLLKISHAKFKKYL
jgi:hypothetical protein